MAITHCAIAVAGTSLVLGTAEPLPLGLAIVGSQIPDIDTTTSTIGKIFFPISSWIEDRYPHRSITHCLLATAAITLVCLGVNHFLLGDIRTAVALPFGHLLACFSDTFTKQGVQLFYPEPAWAISVSNPRRRIKTGSASELWVLAIATALLVLGIYLGNSGGLTTKVSQNLGLRDGVIAVYNENAATNHVYARIRGVWASDRSSADGKYWIVGLKGSEFVVSNGEGIYKTGEQIITTKVSTSVGDDATTEIKSISFNDENAVKPLLELQRAYPEAEIFLSGQLGVDFPEEINISIKPKQYATASLAGSTLNLKLQNLNEAILLLRDQYAVGTVEAKIVQPKPKFK